MTVSACIITYDHENFIEACLNGAINQVINCDYEIVIGDDCSNDRTSEICENYSKKYPNLIKYFRRKKNLGMIGNWIETINDCSGKYIALCEGDDYWTDPHKLQKQVEFLESNKSCNLVFTNRFSLFPNGKLIKTNIELSEVIDLELLLKGRIMPSTQTVMFRKDNLNELSKWKEIFSQGFNGDWILLFMLTHDSKIGFISDCTAVYRESVGIISKSSIIAICQNGMNTNKKINKLLKNKYRKYLLNFEWHYKKMSIEMFERKKWFMGIIYFFKKQLYSLFYSRNSFFSKENWMYFKHVVKLILIPSI